MFKPAFRFGEIRFVDLESDEFLHAAIFRGDRWNFRFLKTDQDHRARARSALEFDATIPRAGLEMSPDAAVLFSRL